MCHFDAGSSQFEVEVTRTSTQGEDFEWPQFMGAKPDDSMHDTRTITGLYISDATLLPVAAIAGSMPPSPAPCSQMMRGCFCPSAVSGS